MRFRCALILGLLLPAVAQSAETHFELGIGAGYLDLDLTQKRGPDFVDQTSAYTVMLGAYRSTEDSRLLWGAAIEYTRPTGRDDSHPGSGAILGFRPINVRRHWSEALSSEFHAGIARYEWEKSAAGYYLGGNLRYSLPRLPLTLGLEVKYYRDLAYDNPFGDQIVEGFHYLINLTYAP